MQVVSRYATDDHTEMWLKGGRYDERHSARRGALWRRVLQRLIKNVAGASCHRPGKKGFKATQPSLSMPPLILDMRFGKMTVLVSSLRKPTTVGSKSVLPESYNLAVW